MNKSGNITSGIAQASILAGPIFVLSSAAADAYCRLPAPIIVDMKAFLALPVMIGAAAVFGAILSIIPNAIGAVLMNALSERVALFRLPPIWGLAGAAIVGVPLSFATTTGWEPFAFGLVITSASCALLCRRSVHWS